MKFFPLKNRVVIKELPRAEKSEGGIIIPETAEKSVLIKGKVQYIGAKVESVKEGDTVLYPSFSGSGLNINGEDCIMLMEEEISAIV